jgi:predicted unusual protein kinase regulating ubiquinone biosynthesis (AarF/ABC1/UbiB family)
MARDDRIPVSRWSRAARVGRLAATQGAKQAATRAANITRSDEGADRAMARRQIETAEQIVTALGTMKGAAMKLGQTLSFLDVGLVPAEYREEFQVKLAALRDAAPKVAFKDMKNVLESEYDAALGDVFESFDPVPIAAASIGQVYRARYDGREVAVKVQYPGVASAVRADLQNLGLILRLMKSVAPGLDPQAMGAEIRERTEEELDYELEAQNQRTLARLYRGHPFIVIPDVFTELSHEKVIVSEFMTGRRFEELKSCSAPERDRIGEIIFRFYFGSMYRHRQFSGDPHPGNCLLLPDGRMAFLDFGLFKHLSAPAAEYELQTQRLGIEHRGEELIAHLAAGGWIGDPESYTARDMVAQFEDFAGWYAVDGVLELTPEIATDVMLQMSDPRRQWWGKVRRETLPPEHLFGRRLEMLTLAVIGQLHATANWHAIAREWIYADEPVTELGREEAEYLASR